MNYLNPNDLKVGDKIKYVSHKSWYHSCCNNDGENALLKIGKIYTVVRIDCPSSSHMALPEAQLNPLVKDSLGNDCGTTWYGSWVYANKQYDLSHINPYGIVKFLAGFAI